MAGRALSKRVQQKKPLDESIAQVLSRKPRSVPELLESLPRSTYWAIKKAVDRMEKRGDVIRVEERTSQTGGRPEAVYLYVGSVPLTKFMQVMDTAEAEQAKAPEDIQRGVIYDVVTKSMYDPEFDEAKRREYFARAAAALIREDPKKLLVRFAQWLFAEHKKAVAQYILAAEGKAPKAQLEDSESTIHSIEGLVRVIFNRNLGVPEIREKSGAVHDGPVRLRFRERAREVISSLKEDELARHLELHVVGDSVLQKAKAKQPKSDYSEAGTDASIRKFDLSLVPSAFEKVRMAIVTAASVRLNFNDPRPPQIDARPEPRQWRYYTEDDAVDKGLLVPPEAYLRLDDLIWERVTSASMNLRQYKKDAECFDQDEYGRIPDVLFRDGRIFPLEHLFDDYCQAGIHGRVVRKSIEAFRDLVIKVSGPFPNLSRPLYCGAVKRPEVAILSPLVFWYMKYGSNPPIWPSMDDRKFLLRIPMSDQRVAHYLFAALASQLEPDERWVTCRFLRRFVSMNEKVAKFDAETSQEWNRVLQKQAENFPAEPDVDPYAELCARGAITAFYASLPRQASRYPEDYLTPRYEVLLPYQIVEGQSSAAVQSYDDQLVQGVLMALADSKGFDVYPESLSDGQERGEDQGDEASQPVFIFPKATCLAHEHSKAAGGVYERDFLGFLWKIIIEVVKATRRKASYIS